MIIFEFGNVEFRPDESSRLKQLWNFAKFLFRKETKGKEMLVVAFEKGDQEVLFSHDRYFIAGIDAAEAEEFSAAVPEAHRYFEERTWRDTTPAKDVDTTIGHTQQPDAPSSSTTPASPAQ